MITLFDMLVFLLAIMIMVTGFSKRMQLHRIALKKGFGQHRPKDIRGFFTYILGQKEILHRKYTGVAHLIIVWGMLLFAGVTVAAQFRLTLPSTVAAFASFLLDGCGLLMLGATLFFLGRRVKPGGGREGSTGPAKVVFPMVILLVILITGFLSEGARLSLTGPAFAPEAPAGWVLSAIVPASPIFMQIMIRLHFFSVMLFLAAMPYTFMRHIVSSSAQVLYRENMPSNVLSCIPLDRTFNGIESVNDLSAGYLREADACVSCGRCEAHCPAFISGKPLSPRSIMGAMAGEIESVACKGKSPRCLVPECITTEEIWSCTTCMACVEQCPLHITPLDKIIELRRHQVMARGMLPDEAKSMMYNLEIFGDVNGRGAAYRTEWAFNQDVPIVSDAGDNSPEVLIWVGCSGAFHPAYQKTTRALVKLLNAGGIHFAILGKDEYCCGDPARRLGNEVLFQELAQKNIEAFETYGIKQIVTLCPHCLNTLGNEYPRMGSTVKVVHASELITELLKRKKIQMHYPSDKTVAIQDPCYLGRYNGIYAPLRALCKAIPGVTIKELPAHGKEAFCCGGGGGRMWLHESSGRNINDLRAREFADGGIELVGTACPYCLTMLEDGIKSLEMDKPPRVMDIIELAAQSLKE